MGSPGAARVRGEKHIDFIGLFMVWKGGRGENGGEEPRAPDCRRRSTRRSGSPPGSRSGIAPVRARRCSTPPCPCRRSRRRSRPWTGPSRLCSRQSRQDTAPAPWQCNATEKAHNRDRVQYHRLNCSIQSSRTCPIPATGDLFFCSKARRSAAPRRRPWRWRPPHRGGTLQQRRRRRGASGSTRSTALA